MGGGTAQMNENRFNQTKTNVTANTNMKYAKLYSAQ